MSVVSIYKRLICALLVGIMFNSMTLNAFAEDKDTVKKEVEYSDDLDKVMLSGVSDIDVQLHDLYNDIGNHLNIDYKYVEILHLVAGGKVIYGDKRPNIYVDETVHGMDGSFDIIGSANNVYNNKADWIKCQDSSIDRPSKYYLPDAAYSVTHEIVRLMNKRYYADRGELKSYFIALNKETRTNILFYEAVLEYCGFSGDTISNLYPTYEALLYNKSENENIVEVYNNSETNEKFFSIKDKFVGIFKSNNIGDARALDILAIMLSFDKALAVYSDPADIKEYIRDDSANIPYKIGYTSRENMLKAAMTLVGKVRYVWGGGHLSTGKILGINPVWKKFFNTYSKTGKDLNGNGYRSCIEPNGGWCPIHGSSNSADSCLFSSGTVYSLKDYLKSRESIVDTSDINVEELTAMTENIDFRSGVTSHRLDGLDCSGYASWLYNQISSSRTYDSSARYFIASSDLKKVEYGDEMLPGDIFTWGTHIVVVIGKLGDKSRAYIMTEASPNMVKFGVIYYGDATSEDIKDATELAKQANQLLGDFQPENEPTHVYNMNKVGYFTSSDGTVDRYAEIGRLKYSFIDEDIITSDGKKYKDYTAYEVIQHTINNMPSNYISGIDTYKKVVEDDKRIFDIPEVKTKLESNENQVYMESGEYNTENTGELKYLEMDDIN